MTGEAPEALYAWQEFGHDGRWGIIAMVVPEVSPAPVPLVFRSPEVMEKVRPLAESHARASQLEVRMHRFIPDPDFDPVVVTD